MKGVLSGRKLALKFICFLVVMSIIVTFSKKPVAEEKGTVRVRIERIEQQPEIEYINDPTVDQYGKYVNDPLTYGSTGKYKKYINLTMYDKHFQKYTKMYFGYGFDFRWFKAQAVAESNLAQGGTKEKIRSHVGAQGIMQIMPGTWREITRNKMNKYMKGRSVFEAEYNIAAGIYYDRTMGQLWKVRRSFVDWMSFIFASYNAGAGNIMKAQRKVSGDANVWNNVAAKLHLVTGRHHKETLGYVSRIFSIKGDL